MVPRPLGTIWTCIWGFIQLVWTRIWRPIKAILHRIWRFIAPVLNFYRIHFFMFFSVPLTFSLILWLSNGQFPIKFVDSLFLCISAATGAGLTTADLSSLTAFQQAIIMFVAFVGNQAFVGWAVVLVRRRFYRRDLSRVVRAELRNANMMSPTTPTVNAMTKIVLKQRSNPSSPASSKSPKTPKKSSLKSGLGFKSSKNTPISPDMIQRLDVAPTRLSPDGNTSRGGVTINTNPVIIPDFTIVNITSPVVKRNEQSFGVPPSLSEFKARSVRSRKSPESEYGGDRSAESSHSGYSSFVFPPPQALQQQYQQPTTVQKQQQHQHQQHKSPPRSTVPKANRPWSSSLLDKLIDKFLPGLGREMERTLTMPRVETLVPKTPVAEFNAEDVDWDPEATQKPYMTFRANVGRNSNFHDLDERGANELAGVEYRALNTLLWVFPLYYVGTLIVGSIVVAPYMSQPEWASNFVPPQQHRKINAIWFSVFQVASGWANTGMSLVDQSMVPFRKAYLMLAVLIFCVMAGNSALPIFLRSLIWTLSKIAPEGSRMKESTTFLLDHPRRCTMSLFPAKETWLLLGMIALMNTTLSVGDVVLNIGNPNMKGIDAGTRAIMALWEAASVRSSGFTTISPAQVAPAAQVLWVIMMYIAIYPIAMSVRSTNVDEEKDLSVSRIPTVRSDAWKVNGETRVGAWGGYFLRHARRQLALDMWWLALSLFSLCVAERGKLMNSENATWLNIFTLLFEVVSAYGTVGLSTGSPFTNYSLSGSLRPFSKLVICLVMLRGRHRGLPSSLDRAVMLPHENLEPETPEQESPMEMGMIPILSMPVPRVVIPENIPESSEEESPSGGSSTEVGTPDSEKDKKLESVDEFEIQEVPREKVEANV